MSYLVRKISRGKWPEKCCKIEELKSDAIADLRSTKNTLSFWLIETLEELDNAILAISTGEKKSDIETTVVICLEETVLKSKFDIECSEGDTSIENLKSTHRDLANLTYKSLGDLATLILESLENEAICKRYSKSEVAKVLVAAYKDKRLDKTCNKDLLEQVLKRLEK